MVKPLNSKDFLNDVQNASTEKAAGAFKAVSEAMKKATPTLDELNLKLKGMSTDEIYQAIHGKKKPASMGSISTESKSMAVEMEMKMDMAALEKLVQQSISPGLKDQIAEVYIGDTPIGKLKDMKLSTMAPKGSFFDLDAIAKEALAESMTWKPTTFPPKALFHFDAPQNDTMFCENPKCPCYGLSPKLKSAFRYGKEVKSEHATFKVDGVSIGVWLCSDCMNIVNPFFWPEQSGFCHNEKCKLHKMPPHPLIKVELSPQAKLMNVLKANKKGPPAVQVNTVTLERVHGQIGSTLFWFCPACAQALSISDELQVYG